MAKEYHAWDCECMNCSWQYTRNGRRHRFHDGTYYEDGPNWSLWTIASSAPYGQIQDKHGYDLYHKGKLIKHGKTVKYLKLLAEEMHDQEV